MDESGYRSGGTTGGKWGCALAALVGLPLFGFLILVNTLGDCAPGDECRRGDLLLPVIVPVLIVSGVVGFGSRAIINRTRRRGRGGGS